MLVRMAFGHVLERGAVGRTSAAPGRAQARDDPLVPGQCLDDGAGVFRVECLAMHEHHCMAST